MPKYEFSVDGVSVESVFNWLGGPEGARRALRGEVKLVEVEPDLVRVDRTIRPTYPSWMREVLHPELEMTGPSEFDCSKLEQWLHDDQKDGVAKGEVIYHHLKQNDMLSSCLNLRDLEEIQKKGIAHFRRHFQGKAVFGWKSVVRIDIGLLNVPYLFEDGDEVVLSWRWLDGGWGSTNPALRLA